MNHRDIGIFFDRDGTINAERDYLFRPEELDLIPGSAHVIREANQLGVRVFIITNQSGVARGLYSESDVLAVHTKLSEVLDQNGAYIDHIYYCPHHPEYGGVYRKDCTCRKPNTGMLNNAVSAYQVNLKKSFVVGDKLTDIMTGINAGCGTVLVLTGYGYEEQRQITEENKPDIIVPSVCEAWNYIKQQITHGNHKEE